MKSECCKEVEQRSDMKNNIAVVMRVLGNIMRTILNLPK